MIGSVSQNVTGEKRIIFFNLNFLKNLKFCFPAEAEFLLSVLLSGPSSIKRQDR